MDISIGTPGLLFPAISLLLLAYTNRFIALASIIRQLSEKQSKQCQEKRLLQMRNLKERIKLIRSMQIHGVLSMLFCVASISFIFMDWLTIAKLTFGAALVFMCLSLLISLRELMLSGNALNIEIEEWVN